MATDKQIEANRLNAQHCTGPKTEEGKARSSQNALKSGLYSQKEVIATESREDYEALAAEYHDHFAPATPQERSLVDALVRYEWLSRRYMAADTAVWNCWLNHDDEKDSGVAFLRYSGELTRAGRYFTNARRGFSQTLKELKALQAERKADDNSTLEVAGKPKQNQSVGSKLVSFRQPQDETPPALPAYAEENGKQPPNGPQSEDVPKAA